MDVWLNKPDDIAEAIRKVNYVKISGLKWTGEPMKEEITKMFGLPEPEENDDIWDCETVDFAP